MFLSIQTGYLARLRKRIIISRYFQDHCIVWFHKINIRKQNDLICYTSIYFGYESIKHEIYLHTES